MIEKIHTSWVWYRTWNSLPVWSWIRAAKYFRQGSYTRAAELYQRGLLKNSAHPASICARLDLAYCHFRNKNFEHAIKVLKQVVNDRPDQKEGHLRLARMHIWLGQPLEAVWVLRRGVREVGIDVDLVSNYLLAVIENGGPNYLIKEGVATLARLSQEDRQSPKLELAVAMLANYRGRTKQGRTKLTELACGMDAPFEAVIAYAAILLDEDRVAHARQQLRRALSVAPEHPRVLSLLANSYIKAGPFYNAEFARQLAQSACQNSGWVSPRELHVYAECLNHTGDRISALNVAHKAKEQGNKLLSTYPEVRSLDRLIESLSEG